MSLDTAATSRRGIEKERRKKEILPSETLDWNVQYVQMNGESCYCDACARVLLEYLEANFAGRVAMMRRDDFWDACRRIEVFSLGQRRALFKGEGRDLFAEVAEELNRFKNAGR